MNMLFSDWTAFSSDRFMHNKAIKQGRWILFRTSAILWMYKGTLKFALIAPCLLWNFTTANCGIDKSNFASQKDNVVDRNPKNIESDIPGNS